MSRAKHGTAKKYKPTGLPPEGRIPDICLLAGEAKYQARELRGPRSPDGSIGVESLAVELLDVLERTWRAGFRNDTLTRAAWDELRRRKRAKVKGLPTQI